MVQTAAKEPSAAVIAAAKKIRLIAFDVDGVLTDGQITYTSSGGEIKSFHVRDGHAIKLAVRAGLTVAVITGRESDIVNRRCDELGIGLVFQGIKDKRESLRKIMDQTGLSAAEIAYMGDDVVDLPVMLSVGLGCCPCDAAPEVLNLSQFATDAPGGRGAARELIFFILREQGLLDELMERYI